SSKFERTYPDFLIVLSLPEFGSILSFVRSNQCSTTLKKPPGWGTLQVVEFSDQEVKPLCIVPCEETPGYLSKILTLSSILWTDPKSQPIRLLDASLRCDSG